MDWEDILKNIQISGQKTSSRDYVKPDEDDEDCFKWWRGLFAILNRLILAVDKNATIEEHDFADMTNEYLCQKKEELLKESVIFYTAVTGYLKYGGTKQDCALSIAIEDYEPQLFVGVRLSDVLYNFYNNKIPIQLEENTANVKTYTNAAVFEVVKKFHNAELDLIDYVNIDSSPMMSAKLIEIYDDYLREKFDVKKNIQISGQKTSSRDYVKPDDDDEDCREWWRELHRIFNKMINAIDRNATLVIDNQVETTDNQLLCELRDEILRKNAWTDYGENQVYGKSFIYGIDVIGRVGVYVFGHGISDKPNPLRKSELKFQSEIRDKYLFNNSVPVWNDTIVYELDRIKKRGEVYAYNIVEPFLNAELELKKHINDPNPAPFIAPKIIALYEKYLNSDIKKSITVGSQKTSGRNYVKPERNCYEEVQKIADKIMKFEYSDEFNMDNPVRDSKYSKYYVNNYYNGMTPVDLEESERLSLETFYVEELDEETCCLVLETIDKYKGQNFVEVEVSSPNSEEQEFFYIKDISSNSCLIQIYFTSEKYSGSTLFLSLNLNTSIPPSVIVEIEDIFESR